MAMKPSTPKSVMSVWILLLAGCGGSSPLGGLRHDPLASQWFAVGPHTAAEGRKLFESATHRYATVRSYRDHGFATTTLVGPERHALHISHFDTLFVRDVGFRLRFYDEQRHPKLMIWRHGDAVMTWDGGKTATSTSFGETMAAARGVTEFVSEVVPSLLLGLPAIPAEQGALPEMLGAGTAPGSCGRCRLVALGSAATHRQHVFTIDESDATIRRFQSFLLVNHEEKPGAVETIGAERLVVYEPEFNLQDEAPLIHELGVQPW